MYRLSQANHSRNINSTTRRTFLGQLGVVIMGSMLGKMGSRQPKKILLRSSWQTINIGDIAHTPGVLTLLERYLPGAEVYLWPSSVDNGVDRLLFNRFPKLKIIGYSVTREEAFETCDFLLHGSGPSLLAEGDIRRWTEQTGKPYGIYGITFSPQTSTATAPTSEGALRRSIEVLNNASFVYFRDSKSLEFAKNKGCNNPVMEFGPDGTFACDLRDDEKAIVFLNKHGLETGKFLCCIPRLRFTPHWRINSNSAFDEVKHARNEEMQDHDHEPLRQAILNVIQGTDLKILICPEDRTQMRVGKELIYGKLPAFAKSRVVWRPNYWLTGEAISTYTRSAGLFGNELHSAIMCIGHGIPAIICRWEEQTWKGLMWQDIGLDDWLFDLDDDSQVAQVPSTVLAMAKDPEGAKVKAYRAQRIVIKRQQDTMDVLRKSLQG